jgi:predicted acetyltransferase
MSATDEHPEIRSQRLKNGETLIELNVAERAVSRLYIIPRTISIGVARVRVDGIGGVETEEEYRGRGYASRIMEAALTQMGGEKTMSQDPAALSFLFGIPNFYEKFGYARAGPWYSLHLTELVSGDPLPDGWAVRPCTPQDLPAIHALYERGTARAVGAVIRHPSGHVWSTLAAAVADSGRDECRVVVDPSREVTAYAWRGRDFWPVDTEEETPDALVIGEAIALGPAAADVLLAACRSWALEELAGRPSISRVQISLSPDSSIYAAATQHHAKLEMTWEPSGGFMVRTLHVSRLLAALTPELTRRLRASADPGHGALRFITDIGEAVLEIAANGVVVRHGEEAAGGFDATAVVHLSSADLARLAFGTFPTGDFLDRLGDPPDAIARWWLEILFPQRHPYTHLPDWV